MLKRFVDIAASTLALLLLSPVFLLVACAVMLDSGRPIFFRQARLGRGFRSFSIWKFRSMRVHAPGSAITVAGDPRITRVGRILRASKLDELPQLWNVLRGDMSLVGPRPEVPEFVEMYRERYLGILQVRPGITDLASVRFRGEEAVLASSGDPARAYREHVLPTKLGLADEYLRRRSFAMDISILFQTLCVVLKNPALDLFARLEHADRYHRSLIWIAQILLFALSGIGAFWLRFDYRIPRSAWAYLAYALPIWLLAKSLVFRRLLLDRGWWRFFSLPELMRVAAGNLAGSAIAALAILWLAPRGFPRSVYVLDFMFCFLATAGIRGLVRTMAETVTRLQHDGPAKRVFIYGAGTAGQMLFREIRANPALPYTVCGFVDDDPNKLGLRVQGAAVVCAGDALAARAARLAVEEVLVAIPSATGAEMTRILHRCHSARLACKTVPSLAEIMESHSLVKLIRDVDVNDVLGRTPVRLELDHIRAKLEGQAVLVTGAGGSIGAELCRQIARFTPRALIAYEIAETPLFEIQNELLDKFPRLNFQPEIGDIRDAARLSGVMARYQPEVVYHAAAYKHVPMMERHVFQAIENNVFGTYHVARIAAACGVQDFVMISSDKAVNPVNVMGASKRLAELVVNSMQDHGANLVSVRFGNVLGSSGSVIPLFKRQIAAGGPLTITHPEMRRYFMTIPEAVQLVLQASTMGSGGEIFVLDMGQPVKIVDLARNLILLSGLRPGEDIQLEFTGLRPGEKLYEEVNLFDESMRATPHEKIKIFNGRVIPWNEMAAYLERLRRVSDDRDTHRLLLLLKELVPEYNPSSFVLSQAFAESEDLRQSTTMLGAIA